MSRTRTGTIGPARERGSKSAVPFAPPARGAEALATAAVCVALGVVLPFFIHPFGWSPRVILPMHFPVFLGGMLLGPIHAAMVGILAPALSMGLTGMPTAAQVLRMMPELAVYGLMTSIMLHALPTVKGLPPRIGRIAAMVLAMLVAMIAGRVTYIAVSVVVTGIREIDYYAMVLIIPAIPGMIAQLVIVPPLAYKLHRLILKS